MCEHCAPGRLLALTVQLLYPWRRVSLNVSAAKKNPEGPMPDRKRLGLENPVDLWLKLQWEVDQLGVVPVDQDEAGKLIFVIVVLSGTSLKQVMLEPPGANNLEMRPRRSKQH